LIRVFYIYLGTSYICLICSKRRQRKSSQVMSSTSKTFIQLFLKREIRGIREFLRKFLNCDTWQLFSIRKVTFLKLRWKHIPSSVSVLRLVLPSTKTCSFSFLLSRRLVLLELILSEEASFVLGSSFTKTRSCMKTTTSHFDFKYSSL
jgi:hypothetical protein